MPWTEALTVKISDDVSDMERQARTIASWGPNVYVKIPVSNTRNEPSYEVTHDILKKLARVGTPLDQYSLETVRMFFDDAAAAVLSV